MLIELLIIKIPHTNRIKAFRLTSCLREFIGSKRFDSLGCFISALHIGHNEKPNVMRGPHQRFSNTALQQ